jgi:hypothetical protein
MMEKNEQMVHNRDEVKNSNKLTVLQHLLAPTELDGSEADAALR